MARTKNLNLTGRGGQTEKRDIQNYVLGLAKTPIDVMIDYIKKHIENFEDWFYPTHKVKSGGDIPEYERLIQEKYSEILKTFPIDTLDKN